MTTNSTFVKVNKTLMSGTTMEWKDLCIYESATIYHALEKLNITAEKFLVVLSFDGVLMGTLTDGDIRRALLSGKTVNSSVGEAANKNPILASQNLGHHELFDLLKLNGITHVPIVDDKRKLISVVSLREVSSKETEKKNAVILMVGGLGSRLGELTANCPKPMLKLGDKPILEIILENFREYGFQNFFMSVNYRSEMIESYFSDGSRHGVRISYIRESERMGTAGSLSLYEPINDLPIIVMNGDVLTKVNFSSLVSFHTEHSLDACICTFRHDYQVPYGVIKLHKDEDLIEEIEEKPIYSSLVNAGIYSINPSLLGEIPKNTFYDMPTFVENLIKKKKRVGAFQVQDYWVDIGHREDFHRAETEYYTKFTK